MTRALIGLTLLLVTVAAGLSGQSPEDRYPIVRDDKLGFIDSTGAEVIPPEFQPIADMSHFREGLAWVAGPRGSGYIDPGGRYVIGPQHEWGQGRAFQEGIASVLMWGRNGSSNAPVLIDRSGRVVLSGTRVKEGYSYFSEGVMTASEGGKTGFMDKRFQWVMPPQFADARAFSEGKAAIAAAGLWGFIDRTGKTVVPTRYDWVWPFSEGLALMRIRSGSEQLFGFVDDTGREQMPARFTFATSFKEDRAFVRLPGERLEIIDKLGRVVNYLDCDSAAEFSEGAAAVHCSGSTGFVDRTGAWMIRPQFASADSFWHGLARVAWNGGRGYIDKRGRKVWETTSRR